ncbi:MAG: hypothetical protein JNK66_07700 [Chitinophagales bacterium]|nr:hypothetical protein [Chitinophagales bacterium]
MNTSKTNQKIRWTILFYMTALIVSGVTAIPVKLEMEWLLRHMPLPQVAINIFEEVLIAVTETDGKYPFLLYGYDWLAFAHIVIAIAFWGVYKDPVRNKWLVDFGLIACVLIIPFAIVAGEMRSIPFWWRLVDCSFGVFGALPLLYIRALIRRIEVVSGEEKLNLLF